MMSTGPKRCSKRSCNKLVEEAPDGRNPYSYCSGCREQNRLHKAASRKRNLEEAGIDVGGDENRNPNGGKHLNQTNSGGRHPFQVRDNGMDNNTTNPTLSSSTSPDICLDNEALASKHDGSKPKVIAYCPFQVSWRSQSHAHLCSPRLKNR
jgi:hypothetical protein